MTDKQIILKDFITKLAKDSLRDLTLNGKIKVIEKEKENPLVPTIHIQFYYNERTNKCFIEYKLSSKAQYLYTEDKFSSFFVNKVEGNFRLNTNTWPEIILPEDGKNERCDLNYILSPFTITYWKSLSGNYAFIEDNIEVFMDAETFVRPHGDDKKPEKRFEDFIEKVKEIQMRYRQTFLNDIEKMNYISDYMIISTEYSPTSEEYIKAISDLNIKYNVIVANHKIPEMFDDYKDLYKEFMGKDLKVIDNTDNIVNYYLEIYY